MFKLALDAGHGIYTAGKRCLKSLDPNETREWALNDRICDFITQRLANYSGIEILRMDDITGQTDIPLSERCKKANEWGANFYLSIHHNAFKNEAGTHSGFEVYRYIGLSENGNTAQKQKIIAEELIKAGVSKGDRSSNIKSADFAVLRDTKMEAVLVECAYMDSAIDVPVLLTEEFAWQVTTAIENALFRFAGITKKETETPPAADEPEESPPQEEETPPQEEETPPQEEESPPQEEETPSEEQTPPAEEQPSTENIIVSFFKLVISLIKRILKGG